MRVMTTNNGAIPLPPRTRAILESKLRERDTLNALLRQQTLAINEMVEALQELLDVPEGWTLESTAVGFVAQATSGEHAVGQ
jgi:hypothetical protein